MWSIIFIQKESLQMKLSENFIHIGKGKVVAYQQAFWEGTCYIYPLSEIQGLKVVNKIKSVLQIFTYVIAVALLESSWVLIIYLDLHETAGLISLKIIWTEIEKGGKGWIHILLLNHNKIGLFGFSIFSPFSNHT